MQAGKVAVIVQEMVLRSGWDTVLIAAPFVGLLFAVVFRLDEVFVRRDRPIQSLRRPCGTDENGEPLLTDPDGRPSRTPPRRR